MKVGSVCFNIVKEFYRDIVDLIVRNLEAIEEE